MKSQTPILAIFSPQPGVGKTTLVQHIGCILSQQDYKVLLVDLDPSADLTRRVLTKAQLRQIHDAGGTVYDAIVNFEEEGMPLAVPTVWSIGDGLKLLAGDLRLSEFDEGHASAWSLVAHNNEFSAARIMGYRRLIELALQECSADIVLVDLGSQLSSLNRSILTGCTDVIIPVTPDSVALQTLKVLGDRLGQWRHDWEAAAKQPACQPIMGIAGPVNPLGYFINQNGSHLQTDSYDPRLVVDRLPITYGRHVLNRVGDHPTLSKDPHYFGSIRNYHTLLEISEPIRKSVFELGAADGAVGSIFQLTQVARNNFETIANEITSRLGIKHSAAAAIPNESTGEAS